MINGLAPIFIRTIFVAIFLSISALTTLFAQSIIIPGSSVISTSPGVGSNQLIGTLFTFPAANGSQGMASILAASTNFGTFTFTSGSTFSTGNDTSTKINTFLGSNAASFSGDTTTFTTHSVLDSGFTLSGYIYVPASALGTAQTFTFASDDGTILTIGGTQVVNNDGIHPVTTKSANAIFSVAGLYSYSLSYYDGAAVAASFSATLPTILYTYSAIPEPSDAGLVLLLMAIGLIVYRKRSDLLQLVGRKS